MFQVRRRIVLQGGKMSMGKLKDCAKINHVPLEWRNGFLSENGSMICIFHPISLFLRSWQHFSLFLIVIVLMNKDYLCRWHQQIHHDHRLKWDEIDEVEIFGFALKNIYTQYSESNSFLHCYLTQFPRKLLSFFSVQTPQKAYANSIVRYRRQ